MPNQNEFNMPGPQFGAGNSANWLKQNFNKVAATTVIALGIIGAVYFYNSYQSRINALKPVLENITASPSPTASAPQTDNQVKGAASAPQVEKNDKKFIATAAKGHGATHLARQTLKEYLREKPEIAQKLRPEHRIYIEDYLQKRLTGKPKTLHSGDQLTFSADDIQNAIDKALLLNDNQIKNLGKYVPFVPSLMTP